MWLITHLNVLKPKMIKSVAMIIPRTVASVEIGSRVFKMPTYPPSWINADCTSEEKPVLVGSIEVIIFRTKLATYTNPENIILLFVYHVWLMSFGIKRQRASPKDQPQLENAKEE